MARAAAGNLASRLVTATTEITLIEGSRFRVRGDSGSVERRILDAARGSIMELAWLTEVDTGEQIGINPEAVVMIRAAAELPDGEGEAQ